MAWSNRGQHAPRRMKLAGLVRRSLRPVRRAFCLGSQFKWNRLTRFCLGLPPDLFCPPACPANGWQQSHGQRPGRRRPKAAAAGGGGLAAWGPMRLLRSHTGNRSGCSRTSRPSRRLLYHLVQLGLRGLRPRLPLRSLRPDAADVHVRRRHRVAYRRSCIEPAGDRFRPICLECPRPPAGGGIASPSGREGACRPRGRP